MFISPDNYRFKSVQNLSWKFTLMKFEPLNSVEEVELDIIIFEQSVKFLTVDTKKDKSRTLRIIFDDNEIELMFRFEDREKLNMIIRLLTSWH